MDNNRKYPSRRSSHSHGRRRKKRSSKIIVYVVFILLILGGFFSYSVLKDSLFATADYSGPGKGVVKITVHKNDTGSDIANSLYKADVIASSDTFIKAFTANTASTSIQPGVYKLKKKMKSVDAVAALLDPKNKIDSKVTIPEGFALEQVIARLVKVAGYKEGDIRKAMENTATLGLPASAKGNLEGWIAPKTYTIGPDDKIEDVLKTMVKVTKDTLQKLGIPENKWYEVLIKGSIIEREVNQPEYYGKVARVIENRILDNDQTNGRLQMDSTVLYGLGKYGGVPTNDDIKKDTPYNTYEHKGLPPTPIGAVSETAIKAAANPEKGPWLYFVTVDLNTGETLFASTLEEQNANTEKLNKFCREHKDICQ